MSRFGQRWLQMVVLATALGLAAGGIAYATIPDSNGVIHGCVLKASRIVRVIDSDTTSCRSTETALNWSQTGPQGATGPQGPPGCRGTRSCRSWRRSRCRSLSEPSELRPYVRPARSPWVGVEARISNPVSISWVVVRERTTATAVGSSRSEGRTAVPSPSARVSASRPAPSASTLRAS